MIAEVHIAHKIWDQVKMLPWILSAALSLVGCSQKPSQVLKKDGFSLDFYVNKDAEMNYPVELVIRKEKGEVLLRKYSFDYIPIPAGGDVIENYYDVRQKGGKILILHEGRLLGTYSVDENCLKLN